MMMQNSPHPQNAKYGNFSRRENLLRPYEDLSSYEIGSING